MEGKTNSIVAKVIRERRSIKSGYTDQPVSQELILELLNDAVWAPNHCFREPWRFIFIPKENKDDFIEDIVTTYPKEVQENKRRYLSQPTAFLIVVMNEDPRQKQWEEDFGAVSSLIQNFQLLAWERELGVVWKTNPHIHDPKVRERAGVEPGEKIVGILHMGYFDEAPKARERTPAEEKFTVYKRC
ncbi:nitroreductase family protein [Desertibacillus haloalkaliphilus]|uniref:nitroreductase family protein n=1 Tax=Desertibacillus haloalkaliphilus TaxID=1328930 RepID=UPI001C263296|nr:nitroreductase [Desertibacillus haloalkaliphilus]MBU8905410.1 nitroreductase [Desertibacillus haloalkaliphilus]